MILLNTSTPQLNSHITKARVLLVEDEPNVGATLTELLQCENYHVQWVKTLAEAERAVFPNGTHKSNTLDGSPTFDLILLDIMLPDGSGFDFAQILRSESGINSSIIFLTALGSTDDKVRGLELGAEDYIVKPFHIKELRLRVRNTLKNRTALTKGVQKIQIGKALIHFSQYQAEVDGKFYPLTQKECTLLRLLVDSVNIAVSRDEILNRVWSEDEFPTPRTIDNFIVKLRRLIEQHPDRPQHIRSVRGVGYQLTLQGTQQRNSPQRNLQ